jgi:hypothetical protein
VSVLAGIVATVLTMVFGGIWYHPKVFGTVWANVHGYPLSSLQADAKHYVFAFLNTLVLAWVFGGLLSRFTIYGLVDSICLAFILWLGFVATTHMSGVIWAKKPFKAYLIDTSFFLVALLIMAVVFNMIG